MKNNMKKSLFWALSLTFALLSCSKELQETNDAQASGTNPEPADLKVWTVNAAIADPVDEGAKANLDETSLQVLWQSGDVIGLVDAEGSITPATLATGAGTGIGTFSYTAEQEIVVSYAFYPYQETATVSGTSLSIKLASSQNLSTTGGVVSQNTLIMTAKPSGGNLLFKNCCAIAKLNISGTENYARKAYLSCPFGRMCGDGTVDLAQDNPVFTLPEVDETAGSADIRDRYTLLNINAVNSHRLHVTPSGPSEPLYFVVPAGSFTGLSVETLGNTDSSTANSGQNIEGAYSTCKEVVFNVGKIRPLNLTIASETGTDLTAGDTYANSFMLTTTSSDAVYSFGAYKRNINTSEDVYNSTFANGYNAGVLWQSTEGLIDGVTYDFVGKRISFVRKASKTGNAVIALRDRSGVTRWSWHIWVTPDAVQTRTFKGFVFMDRNLGAMSSVVTSDADAINAVGTYYQWGRKDPFPGPADLSSSQAVCATVYPSSVRVYKSQNGQSETWALQRPSVYIWGSTNDTGAEDWNSAVPQDNNLWGNAGSTKPKLQSDPCPYGWRVPSKSNLEGTGGLYVTLKAATLASKAYTISDNNGLTTSFPCAGWWRRKDPGSPVTHLANVGNYCYLWTITVNTTDDVLNTDYFGACLLRRNGNSTISLDRKQPRRWGAQVRCVQFDEASFVK